MVVKTHINDVLDGLAQHGGTGAPQYKACDDSDGVIFHGMVH
jgi:hypothetical protein